MLKRREEQGTQRDSDPLVVDWFPVGPFDVGEGGGDFEGEWGFVDACG